MSAKLVIYHHYAPTEIPCESVEAAIKEALNYLEHETGYPHEILDDGRVVWKTENPMDDWESLESLLFNITYNRQVPANMELD